MKNFFLFFFLLCFSACSASVDSDTIPASKAKNHIGSVKTVYGQVVSARYAAGSRGRPTFLNLDKPYPNQIFTIVIWGENRSKFEKAPEVLLKDKKVWVTGRIDEYRGQPQIEVKDPGQIKIESK